MPLAVDPQAWGNEFEVLVALAGQGPRPPFTEAGTYAVVDIQGPLYQHAKWPFDDYDQIRGRFVEALASSQPSVCLRFTNCPGGDFAGAIELSREMRALAKAAGKPVKAFTDSKALSAGMALACAADELVITPSAYVGSVGVWSMLQDQTALDRAMGLKVVVVASGERKTDGNPHVAISAEAVEALKGEIDSQNMLFFELVSEARSMGIAELQALKGQSVFGARAVSVGLASRVVGSWSEFLASQAESQMSKFDEAMGAMKRAAEGDDEDAKKAKKCLKSWEGGGEEDKDKEKSEDEKKKDEEPKAAKAKEEDEAKKAKASDEEKKKDEEPKARALAEGEVRTRSRSTSRSASKRSRLRRLPRRMRRRARRFSRSAQTSPPRSELRSRPHRSTF